MTNLLLFLVLIAICLVGWTIYRSKMAANTKPSNSAAPPSVDPLANWNSSGGDQQFLDLKPGDLIKTDQHDFLVRGTLTMKDGIEWWTHLVDDATGTKRWFSVDNEDGIELGFWDKVPVSDIESGSPGDRSVVVRGVAYKLLEQGKATYTSVGTTSTLPTGSVEYMDYEAADGRGLSIERYDDGTWEASIGEEVLPSAISIYPASSPQP